MIKIKKSLDYNEQSYELPSKRNGHLTVNLHAGENGIIELLNEVHTTTLRWYELSLIYIAKHKTPIYKLVLISWGLNEGYWEPTPSQYQNNILYFDDARTLVSYLGYVCLIFRQWQI